MATGKMAQVRAQINGVERELDRLAREVNSGRNIDGHYRDHLECRLADLEHIAQDIGRTQDRHAGQTRKALSLAGLAWLGIVAMLALSACGTATPRAHAGRVDPAASMCIARPIYWLRADGHMLQGIETECGLAAFASAGYVPAVACATGDAVRLYYVVPCTAAHTYVAAVDGSDK